MQYILAKSDVIEVNPYAIQLFYRVKCIWFKSQILAVAFIQGQQGGIYDCICTASCSYYPTAATMKAVAIYQ